ncbi:MAG: hypothetical protein GY928_40610, partial [Colwellia sp.]|nr:hypothetical protein [Colwellia sp.]
ASLEYGLIHYQPYEIKNKTSILQNKFLRLMIPCKKQNPIAALEIATNIEPMEIRYKYLNLRQTARTFHSDQYHPSHKTYKCLQKKKELILRNKYRTKKNKNNRINHFSALNKNVYFESEKFLKIMTNIDALKVPFNQIFQSQITANPTYTITPFPSNFSVNISPTIPPSISEENDYTLHAATDGSCVPNPGKGAAAYHIPAQLSNTYHEHNGPYAFHRPVTITETEITAIHLFLNKILTDKVYDQILRVKIYVDNKPILQFISGETYPKYNNIKIMIQNIFIKLLQIQQ